MAHTKLEDIENQIEREEKELRDYMKVSPILGLPKNVIDKRIDFTLIIWQDFIKN